MSRLTWQASAVGQPSVTVLSPAASVTGIETVRQLSQLLVGASVVVAGAPEPTATEIVRGLAAPVWLRSVCQLA